MLKIDELARQTAGFSEEFQPDVEVLLKACRYAVEFRELYRAQDFAKVERLLTLAAQRIDATRLGELDWSQAGGRQVRGFRSGIDGSTQPLGLVLPAGWQQGPRPLYVWLHGRGDQTTDLHFVCDRLDNSGPIEPEGAIVLHPFGRQCIGYKSAGETDVMEAIDFTCAHYPIDPNRIVLMGFSMGGAGVWHLAAHYSQRFVAASPGAGFAETARYQKLDPQSYPPKYEQMLWSIYDVPGYTCNLFNLPVVAYSGELDKQIQAARVMEQAFAAEGRELDHLIGPGMGHKYADDSLAEILQRMDQAVQQGQPTAPTEMWLQTKHPRYSQRDWLTLDGPVVQYSDTRATANWADGTWRIQTKNVARLTIDTKDTKTSNAPVNTVVIDGAELALAHPGANHFEWLPEAGWLEVEHFPALRKRPGLSGPIDDAFIDPFLVVTPSGESANWQVEQWVRCESETLAARWQTLFRGQLRTKRDVDVTSDDMAKYHLLLWGDPQSNAVMKKIISAGGGKLTRGVEWTSAELIVGEQHFEAAAHVLLAIQPNPLFPERYAVFNSGPTFRSAHDRTNSLQNPHLPDWAIISLAEPPTAESPGGIAAAGFFDDLWQLDPALQW